MKIYLDSIGCRLNQSEIEQIAHDLLSTGHELVAGASDADLAIINTCSVTAGAASDSRQVTRRVAKEGAPRIVLTGCWSTLHPQAASELPNVIQVIPNTQKSRLIDRIGIDPVAPTKSIPVPIQPLPGPRRRTRRFLKAQDGCNLTCSYCSTRLARGSSRSVPEQDVVQRVRESVDGGSMEVVLTGVHLGAWGRDLSPRRELRDLIIALLDQTTVPRIRLSSLEPWSVTSRLLGAWKDPRMCRSLHIPLQSGANTVLRRMGRRTTPAAFRHHLEIAREQIPDVHISTDIIVGFPGETQKEFEEGMEFIRRCEFSGGHVFTYSEREGTRAAALPDPVPFHIRKERNHRVQSIIHRSAESYRARFIGRELEVLWETGASTSAERWKFSGYTDNFLRIHTETTMNLENTITPTRLVSTNGRTMNGEVLTRKSA